MPYGQVVADTQIDSYGAKTAPISVPFRNRIINGAMVIDQRNAGASVTITNTAAGTYTLDRFGAYGTVASKFSVQQNAGSVTPPAGFTNYLGVTSLSAYSVGSGDLFEIYQPIEGFNTADLGFGTANAKTVTLSFWVYSSLTGSFGGAINNSAGNRSYPFSYSIPVANTWTQISITIAGDTTGTWLKTNGYGIGVAWSLGAGSTFSGTANTWAAAGYYQPTGSVSVVGTNGATFYITGVQLEKGSNATSFDYRPYGTELALCQRYCQIVGSFFGNAYNTTNISVNSPLQVSMRAAPSISPTGVLQFTISGVGNFNQSSASANITNSNATGIYFDCPNFTGLTQFRMYSMVTTGGTILCTAEL